jgi:SAM-dependent methyltransferase
MIAARFLRQMILALCFSLIAACVFAQAIPENKEFEPTLGQAGKDVIWLPTAQALADKMLNIATVTPQDYVIDLGSGDGRIVIAAAKRGARALGIEYDPDMVALSQRNAAREGVSDKAQFVKADLFESDFSQATVITMFLLPEINLRLRPTILNLKPGTRIVSNSFHMGDWTADQTVAVEREEGCDSYYCEAFLWIVPTKVEGTWKLLQGELALKQSYQMITGTLTAGAGTMPIANGRLYGDRISFSVGDTQYTGRVAGDSMEGTFKAGGSTVEWKANRFRKTVQDKPVT